MAKIEIQLNTSRKAKHIRISVLPQQILKITFPFGFRKKKEMVREILKQKKKWIKKQLKKLKSRPMKRLPSFKFLNHKKIQGEELKNWAKIKIIEQTQYFAQKLGCKFNKIYIRGQKTIWGSCSKKKNLSFNYKIALLPTDLFNYVILHELWHLKHLNHQKKFWQGLKKICQQAQNKRKELKKYFLD